MSGHRLQDLEPRWAHFCLAVERFVCQDLGLDLKGKTLLLAFSGGGDSLALALWALACQDRWRTKLVLAHLDHGLRPESKEEASSVQDLAAVWQVPVHTGSIKVVSYARRKKIGLEEGARILRYRFLQGLARRISADYILTAHHLNDLAEDILLRLLRGAGWPGLGGMQAWDGQTKVLRPFLLQPKEKLLLFVKEMGYAWFEDVSNHDLSYKRNRIRHQALPLLVRENPGFLQTIAVLWKQAQVDKEYWDDQLSALLVKQEAQGSGLLLPRTSLLPLAQALRLRCYKAFLDSLGPGQALADSLFSLDRLWVNGRIGRVVQFPGNKTASVLRQGILFALETKSRGSRG